MARVISDECVTDIHCIKYRNNEGSAIPEAATLETANPLVIPVIYATI